MRHLFLISLFFSLIAARTIDNDDNNEALLVRKAADVLTSIRALRREEKKTLEHVEDSERAEVEELLETQHELQKRAKNRRQA